MPSETVTPIVGPLLALLRSRKVLTALLTLIVRIIGTYANAPQAILDDLTTLGLAIITAITAEDVARYFFNRPTPGATIYPDLTLSDDADRDAWWFVDTPDGGVFVNGRTGVTSAAGEFFDDEDTAPPEDKTGG